ncbi:hypothetical protein GGS21DRAFT_505156 [Xylaria nigripes]|nr:hypothetical protein GGS21DRAFT_505156 [Xylaria nigripes]
MADPEAPAPAPAPEPALPWLCEARIVNSDTFTPYLDGPKGSLREYLADAEQANEPQYVLDLLQRRRITNLTRPALELLLNSVLAGYPQEIQDKISMVFYKPTEEPHDEENPDSGPRQHPDWFWQNGQAFEDMIAGQQLDGPVFNIENNDKEFFFWFIDVGSPNDPQFIIIILHLERRPVPSATHRDRISHWAIVDPSGQEFPGSVTSRGRDRLRRLIQSHTAVSGTAQRLTIPPLEHGDPSGLLVYKTMAQLFDRISHMHYNGGLFVEGVFFHPTPPWINPDAVRAEAMGHAAVKTMEKLRWKVRLGLYPIKPFNEGTIQDVLPAELAPRDTPPLGGWKRNPAGPNKPVEDSLFGEPEAEAQSSGESADNAPDGGATHGAGGDATAAVHPPRQQADLGGKGYDPGSGSGFSGINLQEQNELDRLTRRFLNFLARAADEAFVLAGPFAERVDREVLDNVDMLPTGYTTARMNELVHLAHQRLDNLANFVTYISSICSIVTPEASINNRIRREQEEIEGRRPLLTQIVDILDRVQARRNNQLDEEYLGRVLHLDAGDNHDGGISNMPRGGPFDAFEPIEPSAGRISQENPDPPGLWDDRVLGYNRARLGAGGVKANAGRGGVGSGSAGGGPGGGGAGGGAGGGGAGEDDDGGDDGDGGGNGGRNPKKRRYPYKARSSRDADGNKVWTVDLPRKRRRG